MKPFKALSVVVILTLPAWVAASGPVTAQSLGGAIDQENTKPREKLKPSNSPLPDNAPQPEDEPQTSEDSTAEQSTANLPALAIYQAMLKANKKTGWIGFRNYSGKQLIYFTALQTMHCRLREIRYSINSPELDQRFDLVKCNPQQPFSMPDDAKMSDIAILLPLGTATYVAVQVVWKDGSKSPLVAYEPCKNAGESTCAALIP